MASDPLGGFDVEVLLDGRDRPGYDDPERDREWLQARRHVLRIADEEGFGPRRVLEMSADQHAAWCARRWAWVGEAVQRGNV